MKGRKKERIDEFDDDIDYRKRDKERQRRRKNNREIIRKLKGK